MLLTIGVSLYTSRVVLNSLGVQDYGVYSVVGGIVTLFSFFNSAMTSATQRFLTFDIGKNDLVQLKKTFNATLNIHIGIAILILLLAETIGLWFVNYKLNLPLERMTAANWVYQFSVITFLLGTIQVPYDALIIAREKMDIYAYMSIAEVLLKLIIVYVLVVFDFDKLILYAGLLFLVSFIVRTVHKMYCKYHFEESKYQFFYEKELYLKLISYSGWNLFGNIAAVARSQGTNVLLNLFFGTVVNAAYGITLQVQSAVNMLVTNFQLAVNPQIIKNYAQGDLEQSKKLILQSAKFSYFLMLLIVCPILFNIDFVLKIWLKEPPQFTSMFVSLCLINLLIDCISGPLMTGAQATGNIKWYQIIVGALVFLNLPIAYILLYVYKKPELIFYTSILISFVSLVFRLYFVRNCLNLSIREFIRKVFFRISLVSITSVVLFLFLNKYTFLENNWAQFFVKSLLLVLILSASILIMGLDKYEIKFLKFFLKFKLENERL